MSHQLHQVSNLLCLLQVKLVAETVLHDCLLSYSTMMFRLFAIALLAVGTVSAFAPVGNGQKPQQSSTLLEMKKADNKMVAASFLTGAFIAANAVFGGADAAFAAPDNMDFGNTEMLLAGRSGGRGGGRVSRAPARRAAPAPRSSTTRIERTTVVQPVYSSPSVVVSPFGYNPLGGFGEY